MSHAYRARMNVTAESSAPQRLKLHDFISKRKTPRGSSKAAAVRILSAFLTVFVQSLVVFMQCIDFWKRPEFKATQYTSSDEVVIKYYYLGLFIE